MGLFAHSLGSAAVNAFCGRTSPAATPVAATNLTGVDDPELTEAIPSLKAAEDVDAHKEAFAHLQGVHNRVTPFTGTANAEMFVAVAPSVKGVLLTMSSTMLFDGAYIEKWAAR